jgi:hypothetical protein
VFVLEPNKYLILKVVDEFMEVRGLSLRFLYLCFFRVLCDREPG